MPVGQVPQNQRKQIENVNFNHALFYLIKSINLTLAPFIYLFFITFFPFQWDARWTTTQKPRENLIYSRPNFV